jgi:signal peptidase II
LPVRRFSTRALVLTSVTAAAGLALDVASKLLVRARFMPGDEPFHWQSQVLIPNVLTINPTRNPDGLFGMSYGPHWLYLVLPVVGIVLVAWFVLRNREKLPAVAYGLILAGALGNLVDRFTLGWVVDFIDFRIPALGFRWFTVNLADAFIVAGIIGLLASELFGRRRAPAETAPAAEPGAPEPPAPDR